MTEKPQLTPEGFARLEDELKHLRGPVSHELAERMRAARETPGDQSDNLELLEAQQELAQLEWRIQSLERALAEARIVEAPTGDEAAIGSRVLVQDDEGETEDYVLVGPAEASPREGRVSITSPVGRALLGARKGDAVIVETPVGPRGLVVQAVS
jgi:transcription elongation factor GreA